MRTKHESNILGLIGAIEDEYGVTVLDARDVGSRALGIESPSSDYDVMFIYMREPHEYVMSSNDDSIYTDSTMYEFEGWDISKWVDHVIGSNPTAVEYALSEMSYYHKPSTFEPIESINDELLNNFNQIAVVMSNRSIAKNHYDKHFYGGDGTTTQPTVKRALHMHRYLMVARWVEETDELPPSMQLSDLVFGYEKRIGSEPVEFVRDLMKRKMDGRGHETIDEDLLDEWAIPELGRSIDTDTLDGNGPDYDRIQYHVKSLIDNEWKGTGK